jgi:hypothetical protein
MEAGKKSNKLEIAMALFVAIVVFGVAYNAITMLRGDLNLANTTQQLSTQLRLAQEEADFEKAEYGFALDENGYAFYRRENDQAIWQRITDDTLFPQQRLPAYKDLQIVVAGELAHLEDGQPQIILQPGEMQAFSLQFIDLDDREYTIEANEEGEIIWAGE